MADDGSACVSCGSAGRTGLLSRCACLLLLVPLCSCEKYSVCCLADLLSCS